MLTITKENNSIKVVGQNNPTYPYSGTLVYPLNSVTVVTDQSDMAVFRSALNNDVLFTGLIADITISGSPVTKEDIGTKFGAIANSSSSGGGGTGGGAVDSVNGQTGTVVLTASDVNAYSKNEVDGLLSAKVGVDVYNRDIPTLATKEELATKANASSLDNYLLKTEAQSTYETINGAQGKYQAKLTAGTGIEITGENVINVTLDTNIYQVVESLPESEINPNKIYLVLSAESGETNLYTEYLYVNSKWEKIGEYKADVDLTPYLKSSEAASTYATKQELAGEASEREKQDSALGGMIAGETEAREQAINNLTATVQGKLDTATYNAEKAAFETTEHAAATYQPKGEYLTSIPDNYVTDEELNAKNYATTEQLNGKQDVLVSGTNIKTINGNSILGEGNIQIETTGGGITDAPSDDKTYGRKNGAWSEITQPDLSNYALKSEVPKQYVQEIGFVAPSSINIFDQDGEYKIISFADGISLGENGENVVVKLDDSFVNKVNAKQDTLVSGTNIKTVNGETILGSGNIVIEGGGSGIATWDYAQIQSDQEYRTNFLSNVKVSDDLINLGGSNNPEHASILTIDGNVYTVMYNVGGNPKVASINIQESVATITNIDAIPKDYATTEQLNAKQDTLVSGTNIKTINGESILGNGDITIEGGTSSSYTAGEGIDISEENVISVDSSALNIPTPQTGEEGTTNNYIYSDSSDTSHRAVAYATIGTVNQKLYLRGRYWGMPNSTSVNLSISAIPEASSNSNGLLSITDKSKLDTLQTEWFGTQSQFDGIAEKDDNTLYFITEE